MDWNVWTYGTRICNIKNNIVLYQVTYQDRHENTAFRSPNTSPTTESAINNAIAHHKRSECFFKWRYSIVLNIIIASYSYVSLYKCCCNMTCLYGCLLSLFVFTRSKTEFVLLSELIVTWKLSTCTYQFHELNTPMVKFRSWLGLSCECQRKRMISQNMTFNIWHKNERRLIWYLKFNKM